MNLSVNAKILAVALVAYIVSDLFLTPLGGLETRSIGNFTGIGYATLVVLFIGLALNVASLAFLSSKPVRSSKFALIGLIFYFPAFLADQTGLFSSQAVPTG